MSNKMAEKIKESLIKDSSIKSDSKSDQEIEKSAAQTTVVEFPTVYSEELNQQVPFYKLRQS